MFYSNQALSLACINAIRKIVWPHCFFCGKQWIGILIMKSACFLFNLETFYAFTNVSNEILRWAFFSVPTYISGLGYQKWPTYLERFQIKRLFGRYKVFIFAHFLMQTLEIKVKYLMTTAVVMPNLHFLLGKVAVKQSRGNCVSKEVELYHRERLH